MNIDYGIIEFPEIDIPDVNTEEIETEEIQDEAEQNADVEEIVEPTSEGDVDVVNDDPSQGDINTSENKDDVLETNLEAYKAHYNYMKDSGFLMTPDDFEFKGDNLDEAYERDFELRTQAVQNAILNQIPQEGVDAIQYLLNGGKDLSGFLKHEQNETYFNSYDLEDENQAKEYLAKFFKEENNLNEQAIKYTLEGFSDEGKLIEIAKDTAEKQKLVYEQKKQQRLDDELKVQQDKQRKTQELANGIVENISQSKWTETKKNEIMQYMFIRDDNNQTQLQKNINHIFQNAKALVTLATLLNGYDSQSGEWSFTNIEDTLKGKVTKSIKNKIDSYINNTSSAVKSKSDNNDEDKFKGFDLSLAEIV